MLGAHRYIDQRARLITWNTDTSRGSVSVVRAAEVAPKCLLRLLVKKKEDTLKSGIYVAQRWTRRRVTEAGDDFPRCHCTMLMLREDVLYGRFY